MKNRLFISCEIHKDAGIISGILKEIRQKINADHFDMTKYSGDITEVAVIVNCFPEDWMQKGFGKPRKYISYQKGYADIRLPMNFEKFMNAEHGMKYLMVVENIFDAITVIGERCRRSGKAEFDSERMIKELVFRLNLSLEQLEQSFWGEPELDTYVVRTAHAARKKPLSDLSAEEIRLLIGQKIGLPHIIPLAVSLLETDPLMEVTYFEGDLLAEMLRLSPDDWNANPEELQRFRNLISRHRNRLSACEHVPTEMPELLSE